MTLAVAEAVQVLSHKEVVASGIRTGLIGLLNDCRRNFPEFSDDWEFLQKAVLTAEEG